MLESEGLSRQQYRLIARTDDEGTQNNPGET
jgi:hypothetical protein